MRAMSYAEEFDELAKLIQDLGFQSEGGSTGESASSESREAMIFVVSDNTSEPHTDFSRYAELA